MINTKNRFEPLDALRGIAALSVVLFHYTAKYREFFGHTFPEKFDFKYGYYGVSLFFIISGFVIFMTVNKINDTSEFIYRRFIRLYPTFWICLLITFLGVNIWGLLPKLLTTWKDFFFNLTIFYRNLQMFTDIKDVDGAYWSLLPELRFYFLIILILFFKQIKNIKWVGLAWIMLIVVENYIYHIRILGLFIDLQFGGYFIAGIIFYKIMVEKEYTFFNHGLIVVTLILNCILGNKGGNGGNFVFVSFVYFIFYLFIFGYLNWLKNKVLMFLGTISYPLYLVHQNLGYTMIKQFELWGFTGFYVIVIVALFFIGVAALITFYLEKPLLEILRNKYKF
jgi:peptidoglycan/LPS O-acetylase OafA/YrhL